MSIGAISGTVTACFCFINGTDDFGTLGTLGPSGLYRRIEPNAIVDLCALSTKLLKGLLRICSDFSKGIGVSNDKIHTALFYSRMTLFFTN